MIGVVIFTFIICYLQSVLYSNVEKEIQSMDGVASEVKKYLLVLLLSIYIPSVVLIIIVVASI